jgi:hypothetical protein
MSAHVWEKSACCGCRYSYHDAEGYLRCSQRPSAQVPKDVLTGDNGCPLFKVIEPRIAGR